MRLAVSVFLFAALTACGEPDRTTTILGLTGDSAAGETTYLGNCSGCHGEDATGSDSYPDLSASTMDDEATVDIILYGMGSMPEYENSLEDQEIADIVAWLNTL